MGVRPSDVAETLRGRARAEDERARVRARALRAKLPRARDVLERAGAREIWLFGSFAKGAETASSDVDLAVAGLPAERLFPALAELMDLFGVRVDLVRLEDAPESLRLRVIEEGRRL